MRLYRLTRRPYADLSGAGGLHVTGRWHDTPAPIVYASESRALAMLEVLVHMAVPLEAMPDDYVFQVIQTFSASVETVDLAGMPGPETDPGKAAAFGSQWLDSRRSALLRVPSIVIPREYNVLVNPAHPDITLMSTDIEAIMSWDRRLFDR